MKIFKGISVGILAVGSATLAPVIPQDMELLYSIQYRPDAQVQQEKTVVTATSTITRDVPEIPKFKDEDGDGLISMAVFANKKGEKVYVQIPESKYKEMGGEGGYTKNPRKEEWLNVIDANRVKAAIAFDAATSAYDALNVSSITVSHTAAASGGIAWIGTMPGGNVGDTITGVTVNGSAATFAVKKNSASLGSGAQYIYLYYYVNPPASAVNYVVSQSGSSDMQATVITYTGANQTGQPDSTASGEITGNLTVPTTTVADNSWLVSIARNGSVGPPGAGTGTTDRSTGIRLFAMGDSNAAKTPAGSHSMEWTAAAGTTMAALASFSPSLVVPRTTETIMFFE